MASCSTLEASSSASNCDDYNYHVFLSFRGADTRNNFTDHLYANLVAYGIHTFRDDEELEKGGDVASDLSRAIEESEIFIIIFSENYADSKWCLDELVKIIGCMTEKGSVVLPVFYHVEPRDVGNQGGSFEVAFLGHAKDADEEKKKTIETWRKALKTAAKLAGYPVNNQSEVELIQRIREDIITRLNRKTLDLGDNIVGMDFHLEQLKSLIKTELDEVHMVGIYGTGGIGKTTIAMAIYNDISSQFDGSSFLKNVGGKGEDGLLKLQKTLLQDILKGKMPKFSNTSEGINVIKDRLRRKRVLIVLDDVDQYEQLETLAGKYGWYGAKSIIIITTKDIHLLKRHGVKKHYEVQKLDLEKSTKLFNWWAFQQSTPKPEYENLSKIVLKYVDGLPIALKVLGGFLFARSENEWNSFMHKLQEMPDRTIQSVLKVSYDKLDSSEQSIFLDIACFFRGEDKDFVLRILGSCAEIGIQVLNDRCLITILENKLDMHDLLQRMGQEIVRQEVPKEPGKRTRLWNLSDVNSVLTKNTGTQRIEGLFVEVSTSNRIQFSKDSFTKMNRLRLLKVYNQQFWKEFEVDLPKDLEFLSSELQYFHFERYPLESVPAKFHTEKEIFDNLKVIDLSYSKDLVEIPYFSSVPNLEILILVGCSRLTRFPEIKDDMKNLQTLNLSETAIEELPSSIGHLKALKHLYLLVCESLGSLPESICNLSSLETLLAGRCFKLKGFPEIKDDMENLQILDLSETAIEELPSSIEHLKALKHLDLSECKSLGSLPESIFNLSSLKTLKVQECPKLERLEVNLKGSHDLTYYILKQGVIWSNHCFSSLKTLNLQCNQMEAGVLNHHIFCLSSLVELSIRNSYLMKRGILSKDEIFSARFHLSELEVLSVGNFNPMARGIFGDIFHQSSLKRLSLDNCNLMEEGIPTNIWNLPSLVHLSLSNCSLKEGHILNHICHLSSLEELSLDGNHFSTIPAGISRLSNLRRLNLSHCKKLQDIPKLPSSLLFLDAQCSGSISSSPSLLSNHSLFNGFKRELIQETWTSFGSSLFLDKGMSIVIPRSSGILEGMRNQSMGTREVTIELPQNWYGNNDLLGFALYYCVKVPVLDDEFDNGSAWESENEESEDVDMFLVKSRYDLHLYCKLTIRRNYPSEDVDKFLIESGCDLFDDDDVSDHVWVIYYPKDAIKEQYRSNQWTHLKASFNYTDYRSKDCGIHLIYASCLKCQRNEKCQQKLCLEGHDINELPFIDRPFELDSLCLRECKNLESLPSTICELKSLTTLSCSGCSQLKIFPEILKDLEKLRELHLDGTAIEELPASIQHLRGLQYLNLAYCNNLVSLPQTICHLKSLLFLSCSGCSQLKSFPEILENMENLEELYLDGTAIKELPASIEHLRGLQNLHLGSLQCLEGLGAASIIQLSKLRVLDLSHCQKLLQIPELPQSLRFLDAHGCPCLETLSSPSSLPGFSLFKSAIEEFECGSYWSKEITILIPGNNGIPEWISHRKRGSEITVELPMDWYQNDNFLGFALYSVFLPLHIESKKNPCSLKCELNFHVHQFEFLDGLSSKFWSGDELWFRSSDPCCHNGCESNRVWVAYYPKVAIKKEYWSNELRHLKASFHSKRVKVEECGLHLIYMPNISDRDSNGTNHLRENTNFNVKRSLDDAEGPHHKKSRHL